MKKGCLFDLDGTLVDSLTDLALSVNEVLKLHHLPTYAISEYNQLVGNGVKKLIEMMVYNLLLLQISHIIWQLKLLKIYFQMFLQQY